MKKLKYIIISIVVLGIITAILVYTKRKEFPVSFIDNLPQGYSYVYDIDDKTIDRYDNMNQILYSYGGENDDKFQNTFFYSSPTIGNLYSVGDSIEGGFCIIELNESYYDVIYEAKAVNESFFPIAQTNDLAFFSVEISSEDDIKSGGLLMWTKENGFQIFSEISGDEIILGGAICGDFLYYTTYYTDSVFYLYRWNYVNCVEGPQLISSSLTTPEIYCYQEKVSYYENGIIHIGNVEITYGSDMYLLDRKLFVFSPNTTGLIICTVYNLDTGEKENIIQDARAFSFDGTTTVTIYTIDKGKVEVKVS